EAVERGARLVLAHAVEVERAVDLDMTAHELAPDAGLDAGPRVRLDTLKRSLVAREGRGDADGGPRQGRWRRRRLLGISGLGAMPAGKRAHGASDLGPQVEVGRLA